jgi:hypothetical protein
MGEKPRSLAVRSRQMAAPGLQDHRRLQEGQWGGNPRVPIVITPASDHKGMAPEA